MDEFLIKNTTKEQREQIVKESLGFSDIGCDEASSYLYDMYQPYIDGEQEIEEITRQFRANYVKADADRGARNGGCMYSR